MFGSGQEVAAELEMIVDLAVAGEKSLRVPRRLETLHLPFSSSCRLVRDFSLVVQVTALPVLDPGDELPLGRTIAPEFIGHDHTGNVLQPLQQLLEEALGRLRTAPTLDQDVEHDTVLVDCPPQVALLAADAEEHLIQMPLIAWPRPGA